MVSPTSEHIRILLLDDDALVRMTLRCGLERSGYLIVEASCLAEAIAEPANGFDIALIDANIPGDSLPNTILALRAAAGNDALPIIVISGAAMSEAVLHRENASFLHKPIDLADLLTTVGKAVRT